MYQNKLNEIRERIRKSRMKTERKTEVLQLLDDLSNELDSIPNEAKKEANQLAELADQSVRETESYPLEEMENSIQEFEVNYPNATRIINRICMMFANIGV